MYGCQDNVRISGYGTLLSLVSGHWTHVISLPIGAISLAQNKKINKTSKARHGDSDIPGYF